MRMLNKCPKNVHAGIKFKYLHMNVEGNAGNIACRIFKVMSVASDDDLSARILFILAD